METSLNFITVKIDEYFSIKNDIDKMEDKVKDLKKGRDDIQAAIIEHMEANELQQVKDAKGRMVYLTDPAVYASFNKENKAEAMRVIKEVWNMPEIFQETVPPSTLSRVIKDRMVNGDYIPEGLFNVYIEKRIGNRKS